ARASPPMASHRPAHPRATPPRGRTTFRVASGSSINHKKSDRMPSGRQANSLIGELKDCGHLVCITQLITSQGDFEGSLRAPEEAYPAAPEVHASATYSEAQPMGRSPHVILNRTVSLCDSTRFSKPS